MPYDLSMNIVKLRGSTPFVLRVGYNDHRSVLDALLGKECGGGRVPVDVLVVEAHWAGRHRELVDQAAAGRQLVIDYRVDQWTIDGAPALPSNRSTAYSCEEIEREAKTIAREALAAQHNTIWTLAPGCHIDTIGGPAWRATLRLLDEMRELSGEVPWARIIGTPAALATPESAKSLIEDLQERSVSEVMLTIGPIHTDRDGENLLRLVQALAGVGLRVHLTHQGAIGLAALAMGAQSFDAGLLGRSESFDFELQRERLAGGGGWRAAKPRAYAAPLLISVRKDVLGKLFSLKAARAAFECDGQCCATRMDGALLYPVTHFMVRRSSQVRTVLDVPVEMRPGQAEALYGEAEKLYEAIRGIRRTDRTALDAADLEVLSERIADVHKASRHLHQVVRSSQWAAS
jgi:hypothetical protein